MPNRSIVRVVCAVSRTAALSVWLATMMMLAAAGSALAHEEHGHPAAIHEGSCEQLGRLAYRLNGVGGSVGVDNAPIATPAAINPDNAYQVVVSETTIGARLADLLAGGHAVMVYESDEEMTGVACGNVGGPMLGDTLTTGLAEQGVPGHTGFAIFTPDGDKTNVEVIIGHGLDTVSASGTATEQDDDETTTETHEEEHAHDDAEAQATPAP
jgi:hypothetical protein